MTKRILHVVSNVAHFADPSQPTGLWLSELTHAHDVFAAKGYEQRIVSPKGGLSPLEPRALKWPLLDGSAKRWLDDRACSAQLATTARPEEINPADYDAIYFTGGHVSETVGRGAALVASGNASVGANGSITGTFSGTYQTSSGSSCNAANHQLEMVKLCEQKVDQGVALLPCVGI